MDKRHVMVMVLAHVEERCFNLTSGDQGQNPKPNIRHTWMINNEETATII